MDYPRCTELRITDFQSIATADVALGALTVIVGPSNSGKSATLRALKAVVRNVNSPSAVRVGKSAFTSQIVTEDGQRVAIERGKSQSTYRVIDPAEREEVYTKAGRSVPEDVQTALGLPLPEGPDLVFASQIDPPYLLSETGSSVAKVLGDLTNASKLQAAAREANRRRMDASRIETIRRSDVDQETTVWRDRFSDLPKKKERLEQARRNLEAVKDRVAEVEKLKSLLNELRDVDAVEIRAHARLETLPEPVDIEARAEHAGSLLAQRHALLDDLALLEKMTLVESQLTEALARADAKIEELEQSYQVTLAEAGTCPVCNQAVA